MKHGLTLLILTAFSLGFTACSSTPDNSPEGMKAIFGENQSQTDACYQKVLKKEPDMGGGSVQLRFMINEEGKAYKTKFLKKKSTLNNKLLNACLKKVVHSWQFPTGNAMDIVYDFSFASSEPEASEEPEKQSDLDVIDTSPKEESSGDEETPAE